MLNIKRLNFVGAMILLLSICFVLVVRAQKQEQKTVWRLGPTASKSLDDIRTIEGNIQRQWEIVQSQKKALFDGAEVPLEAREHCVADKGQYVCAIPATAKAEPEKKP